MRAFLPEIRGSYLSILGVYNGEQPRIFRGLAGRGHSFVRSCTRSSKDRKVAELLGPEPSKCYALYSIGNSPSVNLAATATIGDPASLNANIHPSLFPKSPALCQLAGEYPGFLPEGNWFAMEKIDGFRCLFLAGGDGCKRLCTRNGIAIEGTGHIRNRLEQMEALAGESLAFDGEFQVGGTLAATKVWCERDWKSGGEAGTLHLFDVQTQAEWEAGGSDRPLYERLRMLQYLFDETGGLSGEPNWEWRERTRGKEPGYPHISVLPWDYVANHVEVMDFAKRVWSRGGEGAVIKRADAGYVRDRSNIWMKVKQGPV